MTTNELTALEDQVNALDRATARRVARLVLECGSSLTMALLAVQEADHHTPTLETKRPGSRTARSGLRAFFGALG